MTEDDWNMALDRVEYFCRRLGCRVFGHRWYTHYEWPGDASYPFEYVCSRCHETMAA